MVTEVNAVNFRQNLGDMLNQVQYRNDSILIHKAELFARIRRMQDQFDDLCARIAEDFASTPPEVGMAEIDALIAEERASKCPDCE